MNGRKNGSYLKLLNKGSKLSEKFEKRLTTNMNSIKDYDLQRQKLQREMNVYMFMILNKLSTWYYFIEDVH